MNSQVGSRTSISPSPSPSRWKGGKISLLAGGIKGGRNVSVKIVVQTLYTLPSED